MFLNVEQKSNIFKHLKYLVRSDSFWCFAWAMICSVNVFLVVCLFSCFFGTESWFVCFCPPPLQGRVERKAYFCLICWYSLLQSAILVVCAFRTFLKLIPSSPTMLIQNFQIQFILNLNQPQSTNTLIIGGYWVSSFSMWK